LFRIGIFRIKGWTGLKRDEVINLVSGADVGIRRSLLQSDIEREPARLQISLLYFVGENTSNTSAAFSSTIAVAKLPRL